MVKFIKAEDRKGIDEAITDVEVEKKVLKRLELKAKTYGTDPSIEANAEGKIDVDAVVAMYKVGENLFFIHHSSPIQTGLFSCIQVRHYAYFSNRSMLPPW